LGVTLPFSARCVLFLKSLGSRQPLRGLHLYLPSFYLRVANCRLGTKSVSWGGSARARKYFFKACEKRVMTVLIIPIEASIRMVAR